MMTKIAAFAVMSLILTVTPGPDSLLVLRSSLLGGRRTGARVAGGATAGSLAWGICSATGLTAILAASAQLYRAVQLAGALGVGAAGRFESQGPPGLAVPADLGEFHRAFRLPGQPSDARRERSASQREPADAPPLAYRRPPRQVTAVLAERAGGKRPLLPGLQATAGAARHTERSGVNPGRPAAVVRLRGIAAITCGLEEG